MARRGGAIGLLAMALLLASGQSMACPPRPRVMLPHWPPELSTPYGKGVDSSPHGSCFNAKSEPWLPEVELSAPPLAGLDGVVWRPRWLLTNAPRPWRLGALSAAVVTVALGVVWRRRPGWRRVSVVTAMAPAVTGLALAHHHMVRLAAGLTSSWWCVPREEVFQRHAQLARDSLTLGAMTSLAASVVLLVVAALAWRPWRPRSVVPLAALLAPLVWSQALLWTAWRERALAQPVSTSLAPVAAQGIQLPSASLLTSVRLPDVPLLMIRADGSLAYDEHRGGEVSSTLPVLEPIDRWLQTYDLAADERDRAPFFLLAIDERTPWSTLQRSLRPVEDAGYLWRQWLLFAPTATPAVGAMPSAPVVPFWTPEHPGWESELRALSAAAYPHHVDLETVVGWLDEHGLRLENGRGDVDVACLGEWGSGVTIPRASLDHDGLARCLAHFEGDLPEPTDRTPRSEWTLRLVPSPTTPWRDVAHVLETFARPRPRHLVHLSLPLVVDLFAPDSAERARRLLVDQREALDYLAGQAPLPPQGLGDR